MLLSLTVNTTIRKKNLTLCDTKLKLNNCKHYINAPIGYFSVETYFFTNVFRLKKNHRPNLVSRQITVFVFQTIVKFNFFNRKIFFVVGVIIEA